jgi:hypothetical protein
MTTIGRMLRILERRRGLGWHLDVRDPVLRRLLLELFDPVSLCVPKEPVAMPDGFVYDRKTLERLIGTNETIVSPVTRQAMPATTAAGVFEEKMVAAVLRLVMDHFRLS